MSYFKPPSSPSSHSVRIPKREEGVSQRGRRVDLRGKERRGVRDCGLWEEGRGSVVFLFFLFLFLFPPPFFFNFLIFFPFLSPSFFWF